MFAHITPNYTPYTYKHIAILIHHFLWQAQQADEPDRLTHVDVANSVAIEIPEDFGSDMNEDLDLIGQWPVNEGLPSAPEGLSTSEDSQLWPIGLPFPPSMAKRRVIKIGGMTFDVGLPVPPLPPRGTMKDPYLLIRSYDNILFYLVLTLIIISNHNMTYIKFTRRS